MESHYLCFRSQHGKGEQISSSKGEGKENPLWFVERGVWGMQRKKMDSYKMPRAASQGTFIWPTQGKKSNSVASYKLNKAAWSAKLFFLPSTQLMFALKDVSSKCYYYILYFYYIDSELIKKAYVQCDMILSQQIRYHPFTHVHRQSYGGWFIGNRSSAWVNLTKIRPYKNRPPVVYKSLMSKVYSL